MRSSPPSILALSASRPVRRTMVSLCAVCLVCLWGCPASKSPPPPKASTPPQQPEEPQAESPSPPTDPSQQHSSSEGDEQSAAEEQSEGEAQRPQEQAGAPSTPPGGAEGTPEDAKEEPPGSAGTGAADGDGGPREQAADDGQGAGSEKATGAGENATSEAGTRAGQPSRGDGDEDGGAERAAGQPAPHTGPPGPWSDTGQTKVDELRRRMADVDGILDEENAGNESQREDASTPGGRSLREQAMEGTEGSRPHGTSDEESGEERASAQGPYGETSNDRASNPGGASGPQARPGSPPDVGDGSDDDVVAQQLRELAESEPDPALREAYWCDYRKYKGLVTDCPRPDPEQ